MNGINKDHILGISAIAVDRFLSFYDWVRDYSFPNKNLWVYEKIYDGKKKRIVLPSSEDFEDFHIGLLKAIDTLSSLSDKSPTDIAEELKSVYCDRLQFRVKSPVSAAGKLPLAYAAQCIEGLKNLILYSACAEHDARPVCERASSTAQSSLAKFELGQTAVGSFIINIDTKVADDSFDECKLYAVENTSTEHKVVQRIVTSLKQIDSTISQNVQITTLAENAYETGITANMCDALLNFRIDGQPIEVEATVQYASALTEKTTPKQVISIDERHFGIIEELAKVYRDKKLVDSVDVVGLIKKMVSDSDSANEVERTIYITSKLDGRYRTLKAVLSAQDHLLACDAYRDDKEVQLIGEIDKSQRTWEFISVSKFNIL